MSAGELADQFPVSKPTMSAHFAVLYEAALIEAEKTGRTIVYRLRMTVLEDALLSFTDTLGLDMRASGRAKRPTAKRPQKPRALRSIKGEA